MTFFHLIGLAQLKADFHIDKNSGCSPLTSFFTNKSIGASSGAIYNWDFGNGNTSSLENPGAIFLDEKVYLVTLTVKDGDQNSSLTKIVKVYKNPVVDFFTSVEKGCSPLPVAFNAKATADGGQIVSYLWDFGDGISIEKNDNNVTHIYTTAQKATPTLIVTDSHGCTSSQLKNDLVEVLQGVSANFEADKTFLCTENEAVTFSNDSKAEGVVSYLWEFGDGITSTEKNPSQPFSKGTYSVKLSVSNDLGCTNELIKPAYINVANFKSEMSVPDIVCANSEIELINTSMPKPTSFSFSVNGNKINTVGNLQTHYYFYVPGIYDIELTNYFGSCVETITKKLEVRGLPQPMGFIAEVPEICTTPVTVLFSDTSATGIKSEWNFERVTSPLQIQATGKTANYTFKRGQAWQVTLFVTDDLGCKGSVGKLVELKLPKVSLEFVDNNGKKGCDSLVKQFKFISDTEFSDFTWTFGNGQSSKEAEPIHTFGPGEHYVQLSYTTTKGCTFERSTTISVSSRRNSDFKVYEGSTTVCGNTRLPLQGVSGDSYNSTSDRWYIEDKNQGSSDYGRLKFLQFPDTGTYTITRIISWGSCSDTTTKVNFVTVIPSFPKIGQVTYTCEGDRGLIKFENASRYAESGTWDFGDGTKVPFDKDQNEISHQYTLSGQYKVKLSTSSGDCINEDSTFVNVVLKAQPVLSTSKTSFCSEEGFNYTISNVQLTNTTLYNIYSYQYEDGTIVELGDDRFHYTNRFWVSPYEGTLKSPAGGEQSIRIILERGASLHTAPFHMKCYDTTNFIPIKVTGSVAGFQILTNNECFATPFLFKDTSKAVNSTIISRVWDFGDGQQQSTTEAGTVSHIYDEPGKYNVTLTITDNSGCKSTSSLTANQVNVNGPKAAFSVSETDAHLNANIQFYNTTNNFNSTNTIYEWNFGDGQKSSDYSPIHVYTNAGIYEVSLIVKSASTGCADTAFQKITIKDFKADFSFTSSFLNTTSCSAMKVQFKNKSENFTHIKWEFGDGSSSENNNNPTHIYTTPGRFIIKLHVTGNNGLSRTYTDSVIMEKFDVSLKADLARTCTSEPVTLTNDIQHGSEYLWDLGDGNIIKVAEPFYVHQYKTPGTYSPRIIALQKNGCLASVEMKEKIVIDSLSISLTNIPAQICTPKEVAFHPQIVNTGGDNSKPHLVYDWDFGTGNSTDNSTENNPSFIYEQPGNYLVNLKVQTPFGCKKEVQVTLKALQGLGGKIDAPTEICAQSAVGFKGKTQIPGTPEWKWIFEDGSSYFNQNPPERKYDNPGSYSIQLIVKNNGCDDTTTHNILVNAKPGIKLADKSLELCEGSSISLSASGGTSYEWTPAAGLATNSGATVIANPLTNTTFAVKVTNEKGCIAYDSVAIKVIHPFKLQMVSEVSICRDQPIQLTASGGEIWQWIYQTEGLNNTSVRNPVAAPKTTTTYTLTAGDKNNCFSDTAQIIVIVQDPPTVDAGKSVEVFIGESVPLQATGSNDIISWSWWPEKYLDCISCAAPVATPLEQMTYTVTAKNSFGCIASDTVSIGLLCNDSRIFIPDAFTPNGDGLNDRFSILGQGIDEIKSFRIYDRWGKIVFDRTNFKPQEGTGSWDGNYKGVPAPVGTYIYVAEMTCNEKTFIKKGSVRLLR